MSCWRNYTCDTLKNVDRDIAIATLKEMGITVNTSLKRVEGRYEHRASTVDGVFIVNGEMIDVGIIFNDATGHLSIIGDFWGTGFDATTFQENLMQGYQKNNVLVNAENLGWTVDEECTTVDENGNITMELVQYA